MGILQRVFKRDPARKLRKMAGDFELPSFPTVATQARALLRSDSSTNQQIGACLKQDPGLTVRVLRAVNSAALARSRRISDPVAAVGLLGRANVEYLVLAEAARSALPPSGCAGFSHQEFWSIAAARATIAQRLCERIQPADARLAYSASLLQDMAIPMMAQVLRDRYADVLASAANDWGSLDAREREALGWDHGEFGAWMCEAWSFPDAMTSAVMAHHGSPTPELEAPLAVRAVSFLQQSTQPGPEQTDRIAGLLDQECGLHPCETAKLVADCFHPPK